MRVNETFVSVQGEGRQVGLPTVFVRTQGCNLRCVWCDTTHSFYEGRETPLDDVLRVIAGYGVKRVCLTGGEPLLQKELPELARRLLADGYEVVLETSGSLDIDLYARLAPRERLCISMDLKCPGSRMEHANRYENVALLGPSDQLKFVIMDDGDYEYAKSMVAKFRVPCEVVFQAEGGREARWLAEAVVKDRLDVRVGLQLHKVLWGDERAR